MTRDTKRQWRRFHRNKKTQKIKQEQINKHRNQGRTKYKNNKKQEQKQEKDKKDKKESRKRVRRSKRIKTALKNFKIYYQNVRALKSKLDSLQQMIEDYQPALVCIVETHMQR